MFFSHSHSRDSPHEWLRLAQLCLWGTVPPFKNILMTHILCCCFCCYFIWVQVTRILGLPIFSIYRYSCYCMIFKIQKKIYILNIWLYSHVFLRSWKNKCRCVLNLQYAFCRTSWLELLHTLLNCLVLTTYLVNLIEVWDTEEKLPFYSLERVIQTSRIYQTTEFINKKD